MTAVGSRPVVRILLVFLLVTSNVRVRALSSNVSKNEQSFVAGKPNFSYTGVHKEIIWNESASPVSLESETSLRTSGVLVRRAEFGNLTVERKEEIAQVAQTLGITLAQALNIRKQTLVSLTAFSSNKLKNQGGRLADLWRSKGILELSHEIEQPPVSIVREILMHRVSRKIKGISTSAKKKIIRSIVYNELASPHLEDFLSSHEQKELELAKTSDSVSYIDQEASQEERGASGAWEQSLYGFLDDQDIAYWNEDQLRAAGASLTPDCLLLDDVSINGRPARWIDCKSFYGYAGAKYFVKSLSKQANRYNDYFGAEGAIVYRDGYSSAMVQQMPQALILDRGPLLQRDEALF